VANTIIKFADDTTVVGLITDNDETAYREEVSVLPAQQPLPQCELHHFTPTSMYKLP
jgi:hypothetical protein